MIRVSIAGGDSSEAGDLLRLLVLHPDVEIVSVSAPAQRGRAITSCHKGMVGDTEGKFSDTVDFENTDLLFITDSDYSVLNRNSLPENVKVIEIPNSNSSFLPALVPDVEIVPGLSEMYRKPLVRHARVSRILDSATAVSLIILFPLALHLLLNDSVRVNIKLPKHLNFEPDAEFLEKELNTLLNPIQLSFRGIKKVTIERSELLRTIQVEVEINSGVSEEEIERIYNEIYDDHNFTFLMRNLPAPTEVGGTQKCLLYVSKPESDKVKVTAIADSFMRGGAGDAVHVMNLMFGLYEKTGLTLPASMAFRDKEINPDEI